MGDAPRKFCALRLNLSIFQGHSHACYYSQSNAIANFCVGEFTYMHAVQKICKKQLWHHRMYINHNSL